MLTLNKLKTYKDYGGDVDAWARSKPWFNTIEDKDWSLIDGLLTDLTVVANGYASPEFATQLERRLEELCDNQNTLAALKAMAR